MKPNVDRINLQTVYEEFIVVSVAPTADAAKNTTAYSGEL